MSLRCSSKNSPSWITWAFPTIFFNSDGSPESRRCVVIRQGRRPSRLKTLEPPWFQAPPKARGHLATRQEFEMNHESQVVARHFPAGGEAALPPSIGVTPSGGSVGRSLRRFASPNGLEGRNRPWLR